jgi:hypothetical protein
MEIDSTLVGWTLAGLFGVSIYHLYMRSKMEAMQRHVDDSLRGIYQTTDDAIESTNRRINEIERNMNKDCCKEKNYYNSNS